MQSHQRADARRNYTRILTVAEDEVADHGANASLEQIARIAGVGSATVRRHFPTRYALLEAVSRERIDALCERARELTSAPDSRAALLGWLDEVVRYCVSARGLVATLAYDGDDIDPVQENSCAAALEEAAAPLLERAADEGAISSSVTGTDLLSLIVGIVLVTERFPDHGDRADRLFRMAVQGISPLS